jgi:hypothetical protein
MQEREAKKESTKNTNAEALGIDLTSKPKTTQTTKNNKVYKDIMQAFEKSSSKEILRTMGCGRTRSKGRVPRMHSKPKSLISILLFSITIRKELQQR